MKHLIYGLVDSITHELRYLGRSSSGMRRPRSHEKVAQRKRPDGSWLRDLHVCRWIRELVANGGMPQIVVVQEFDQCHDINEVLNAAERYWIGYFKSAGARLTNLTEGGEGNLGWKPTDETKKKISAALTGRKLPPFSEQHRRRLAESNARRVLSPEARRNMSKAQLGKVLSKEHRENISKATKGRRLSPVFTEETLRKMSAAKKGKPLTEAHRRHISEAQIGKKKWSEASKEKLRQSKTGKKRPPFSEEWKRHLADAHRGKKRSRIDK